MRPPAVARVGGQSLADGAAVAPWWRRWIWHGYTSWGDGGAGGNDAAPSSLQLMVRDLNFWGAMFFLLSSCGYMWYSAVPFMFENYCQDTECGYRLRLNKLSSIQ